MGAAMLGKVGFRLHDSRYGGSGRGGVQVSQAAAMLDRSPCWES